MEDFDDLHLPGQPKHPEYAKRSERLSKFKTWHVYPPDVLSKAGFYYTGIRFSFEKENKEK